MLSRGRLNKKPRRRLAKKPRSTSPPGSLPAAAGPLLRMLRERARISQVEFAALTGIAKQNLCGAEHGRRAPTLLHVAAAWGVARLAEDYVTLAEAG
jgi:DNA-binding XRE family transcriptional regulator